MGHRERLQASQVVLEGVGAPDDFEIPDQAGNDHIINLELLCRQAWNDHYVKSAPEPDREGVREALNSV